MQALELEGENGFYRPKEGLEALSVADELKRVLLKSYSERPNDYITIDGGYDGSPEIRCALKQSSIFRRPFALTIEDAKVKLSAWLEKQRLQQCNVRDQGTNTTAPSLVDRPAQDDPLRTATLPDTRTPPVAPTTPFAMTEADAVRALREREYHVFPAQSPVSIGIVTPPPEYSRYPSSQPTEQSAKTTSAPVSPTNTRKRKAASVPSTPVRDHHVVVPLTRPTGGKPDREIVDSEGEGEDDDYQELIIPCNTHNIDVGDNANDTDDADDTNDANDASDEMCETPPRQHKRRKITTTETASAAPTLWRKKQGTTKTTRVFTPKRPSPPPRCRKTKQSTLTSVFSHTQIANQTGIPVERVGAQAQAAEVDDDADESAGAACDGGEDGKVVEDEAYPTEDQAHPGDTPSPEVECASNLLALQASQPSTPPAAPVVADDEESLPVPEASISAPQQLDQSTTSPLNRETLVISQLSPEERRLFRHFMTDAATAEEQWRHSSTYSAMEKFRLDPYKKFQDCLQIARKTLGDTVLDEWDNFLAQGRPNKPQDISSTPSSSSRPAGDSSQHAVARAAYSKFQIINKAKTSHWKAVFEYRRAAADLNAECDAYLEIRNRRSLCESGTPQQDQTSILKALFREMNEDWRDALPADFSEAQAKAERLWQKWGDFQRANKFGRRWRLFVQELGYGALLFIDTTDSTCFLQQDIPGPVFAAWVNLLARVTTDLKDIGDRMYPYFDGLKDPSRASRVLLPRIRLERRAYRAHSPNAQFDQTDSDGGKTPTIDPGRLLEPSVGTGIGMVVDQMQETDDFEFFNGSQLSD